MIKDVGEHLFLTPDEWDGLDTVENIECGKCGKTLPKMFARDHLDPDFPTNKCPHTPVYEIEIVDL